MSARPSPLTPTHSRRQAALTNPKTFAQRDAVVRAMLAAKELPHPTARVGVAILMHLHVNSGLCNPSHSTIAKEANVGERSVYRHIELLERLGWIAMQRTKGRTANEYVVLDPATHMAELNTATHVAGLDTQPCQIEHSKPAKSSTQHCHTVADNKRRTAKKRKREEARSGPPGALLNSGKETAEEARQENLFGGVEHGATGDGRAAAEPEAKRSPKLRPDIEPESFLEFWAAFPRKNNREGARRRFVRALADGVDAAVLIEGARRYAAERAAAIAGGDPPKYTLHANSWLRDKLWNDPPPMADGGPPVIDQHGNVVEVAQAPRANGNGANGHAQPKGPWSQAAARYENATSWESLR
jgi:helix-turn-helix protein